MKIYTVDYLNELTAQARRSLRKRQHSNIHQSYADPCQCLFNAIEPGSYIRPLRHSADPRDELLIAVRGSMALVTFDEQGMVTGVVRFGTDRNGDVLAVGIEVPANTWHIVIALEPGCVLLEVKAGPFNPNQPKDPAPWAPDEGGSNARQYLEMLISRIIG
jgi:cupin fold WbuC family metalloprotein